MKEKSDASLSDNMPDNMHAYLVSHDGRELLKKHSLNEEGFWQIKGGDTNCDLGGSHHRPDLGVVEGALYDVIAYAIDLPRFWAWGGNGSIAKISPIKKITPESNEVRKKLLEEKLKLEARLVEVIKQIKQIGVK
jgi:hypothetical protein